MLDAVRQYFFVLLPLDVIFRIQIPSCVGPFRRDLIDIKRAADHLDAIAGQAHEPLDEIHRGVLGLFEHHDVAALRLTRQNATREDRRAERQGISAISVGVFRDEKIIAHQQRGLHGAGRNIERLIGESPHHQSDQDGIDDGAHRLAQSALRFGLLVAGGSIFHEGESITPRAWLCNVWEGR